MLSWTETGPKTISGPYPCSYFGARAGAGAGPHLYLGAGTGPESLVRSRNRIRVLISDQEPHSYSGAGTVHEKLTLSATILS